MKPTRRQLFGAGAAMALGSAFDTRAAIAPDTPPRTADGKIAAQLKLSVAAYSFRDLLPQNGHPGKMTLLDLCDLAALWRLDAIEPTGYYFESEDLPYVYALKAKAFKLGLDISGTAIRNNFCLPPGTERDREIAHVKKWTDIAAALGAPCIRIFAGQAPRGATDEEAFAWLIDSLKPSCDYAGSRGVFLAIENHGYLTETDEQILRILETANHEWLGFNLDTGNFAEAPYESIAHTAPKAITCQVKTEVRTADGNASEPADFARILGILRNAGYRGYVALEYEGKEDPATAVPRCLRQLRDFMET